MQLLGNINDVQEIAYVLSEQYAEYAQISEDLPDLDQDWIAEKIVKYLSSTDLELMLENDYTRGLAMGQLLGIYFSEQSKAREEDEDSYGED